MSRIIVTAIAKAKRIKLKHETPLSEISGRGQIRSRGFAKRWER